MDGKGLPNKIHLKTETLNMSSNDEYLGSSRRSWRQFSRVLRLCIQPWWLLYFGSRLPGGAADVDSSQGKLWILYIHVRQAQYQLLYNAVSGMFLKERNVWEAQTTCGGHFASVEGLVWQNKTGNFILTTSQDQTTRCHGYWKAKDTKRVSFIS